MRILLVDDEPVNLKSLDRAIRRGGHAITTLSDPLAALDAYREAPFDVVISDVRMPKMNGIELLHALRETDPKACVILITGFGDADVTSAAIREQAWAMLAKPVDIATILDLLSGIEENLQMKARTVDRYHNLFERFDRLQHRYEKLKFRLEKGTDT